MQSGKKRGIVYIAKREFVDAEPHLYYGHWESTAADEPGVLEQGPGWDDIEDAIQWGRDRAPEVYVRVAGKTYSAGVQDPDGEPVTRWELRRY